MCGCRSGGRAKYGRAVHLSKSVKAARFAEGSDDDLGDEGLMRLQLAVAIRERADDGELVLAHEVGEPDEPRADHHVVGRGKR